MEQKRVTITVTANGKMNIETHGMVGNECTLATAMLEGKLGKVTDRTLKAEFYAGDGGIKVKEEIKKH
jgi:hypothetical protein